MTAPIIPFAVPDGLRCTSCNKAPTTVQIAESDYRCPGCGADLGHLDLAPNGMVRGVLGWLRQPGDVLADRYRVRGFLGKGGFAATYLVEDQRLAGKRRAVKEIPELFFDERETEILARIQHPAVPDITDRFAANGMIYLVLEFGGDRTLESVRETAGGRIALERLRPWADQLCDVLAYLHAQTPPIVHRDLKPANVLLDESNRVMLIDFGIAKEATPNATTRTVARSASHGFSPPEQVMGTGTDERSDVYALGATLYALLTGQLPAPAHERVAGAEIAPLREIVPDVPQAFEDAITCALELSIAKRHASIEAFRRALAAAPVAVAATRKPASMAPRTMMVADMPKTGAAASPRTTAIGASRAVDGIAPAKLLAAGAVFVLLLGAAAWWMLRGRDAEPAIPAVVTEPPVAPPAVAAPILPVEVPHAAVNAPDAAKAPEVDVAPPGPVAPQGSAFDALNAHRPQQPEPVAHVEPVVEPRVTAPRPPPIVRKPAPPPKPARTGWEDQQAPTVVRDRKVQ